MLHSQGRPGKENLTLFPGKYAQSLISPIIAKKDLLGRKRGEQGGTKDKKCKK
ncbi:hypothetical protein FACS189447_01900 [Spirochaetia bacterium]|nr:hypothetical protein FACS189447_01900 [Spirochaetia bacterium]